MTMIPSSSSFVVWDLSNYIAVERVVQMQMPAANILERMVGSALDQKILANIVENEAYARAPILALQNSSVAVQDKDPEGRWNRFVQGKYFVPSLLRQISKHYRRDRVQEGINGTLRLMKYLGMIDEAPAPAHENKIVWSSAWIRARTAGLFHPIVEAGQLIHKGQLVGEITDPFGEYREEVKTSVTGYVVGLNNNPVVNAGDALLHIGMDDHCRLEASGEE
jgi:predicted deacylase